MLSTNRPNYLSAFSTPRKDLIAALIFVFLGCLSFFFFDTVFTQAIAPYTPQVRLLATICSHFISPLYPFFFAALFFVLHCSRDDKVALRPLFEITIVQFITAGLVRFLKVIIGRPRPKMLELDYTHKHLFHHDFHSFPSGHAMAAFALAATLAIFYPRLFPWLLGVALLFSLSRVLLLDHFLSDLCGTAALAIISARFIHNRLQAIDPYGSLKSS